MDIITQTSDKRRETKGERFIRIGERRVNIVLEALDKLAKCANTGNYEYSDENIRIIFKAIDSKTKEVKAAFVGTNTKDKKRFRLDGS